MKVELEWKNCRGERREGALFVVHFTDAWSQQWSEEILILASTLSDFTKERKRVRVTNHNTDSFTMSLLRSLLLETYFFLKENQIY